MPDLAVVAHVAASTGLSSREAARVVEDVLAYYAETTEAFVRRRHSHHRTRGMHNVEIFRTVKAELEGRVVAAPELTERQLRRIIYG